MSCRNTLQYSAAVGALSLFLLLPLAPRAALATERVPAKAVIIDPGEHYNTIELITRTMEALPSCLEYCLLGIELRMRVTWTGVKFYFVPRVKHHMAAMHIMTSDQFPEQAYREWASRVGVPQKMMLDGLAQWAPVVLGLDPIAESGGRTTRYGQFGRQQATVFKEAEAMGHPVALLPSLLDGSGTIRSSALRSELARHAAPAPRLPALTAFIERWIQWAAPCFSDPLNCALAQPLFPSALVQSFFSLAEAIAAISSAYETLKEGLRLVEIAQQLHELAETLGHLHFGVSARVRIDRLLCPNDIDVFYPYYLSGPDALFWRSGWPITDAQHSATLLNPFSSDRIGRNGELWGNIYPRHGFVNNDHPGRTAAVLAYRSAHLVADPSVPLRPKRTASETVSGTWQKLSPQYTPYCVNNIADLPTPIDPEGGYAYNTWPQYTCSLSDVGSVVAFFPYRHCF